MIDRWTAAFNEVQEAMRLILEDSADDILQKQINPGSWTILEHIDHLSKTNSSYFPIFSQVTKGKYQRPFLGQFDFLVSYLGRVILNSVLPDNPKKSRTLSVWLPGKSLNSKDVWNRFAAQQQHITDIIPALLPFMDRKTVINSPGSRAVVYSLEASLDIILAHEQRHLRQIREILVKQQGPDKKI
jgi:hypothetical protein